MGNRAVITTKQEAGSMPASFFMKNLKIFEKDLEIYHQ